MKCSMSFLTHILPLLLQSTALAFIPVVKQGQASHRQRRNGTEPTGALASAALVRPFIWLLPGEGDFGVLYMFPPGVANAPLRLDIWLVSCPRASQTLITIVFFRLLTLYLANTKPWKTEAALMAMVALFASLP